MNMNIISPSSLALAFFVAFILANCAPTGGQGGHEIHVSVTGSDENDGSRTSPLLTIQAAADRAQPGDVITVHGGTYRERVNPPRGGTSDDRRIVYRAAEGEKVVIKGSEIIKGWEEAENDTWKVVIENDFFGEFNPYNDLISGDWFIDRGRDHHTGAVYVDGHWLIEAAALQEVLEPAAEGEPLWYARVDEKNTTIWAQFPGTDPNQSEVEINVRQTVFYPEKTGINYITVRGFTMMHAATPWAPPTAEQVGLIGTHWSRGWIIEQNNISYSTCVGITLGKYGDEFDNTSQDTAEGYVETIERALQNGWTRENIGHHVVRDNHISHCEQAGIVGSLGAIFSTITGNVIHDIHVRRLFGGHEMAGIKIHGAIDSYIGHNHIYRTIRAIWLDWMTQGTRVTGNLMYENGPHADFFIEVNHGPFVVDNNISLSAWSLDDWSQGGTYAHNLFGGRLAFRPVPERATPYHVPHSTTVAGLSNIPGGDNNFYNNIFAGGSLAVYDNAPMPSRMAGNVFLGSAVPSAFESEPVMKPGFDPDIILIREKNDVFLQISLDHSFLTDYNVPVETGSLGKTAVSGLHFLNYDSNPLLLDTDFTGKQRNRENPFPGPFESPETGINRFSVW
jgi:alpha-L-arabinofuranosidase